MASHLPSAPPLSPPDGPPSFVRNLARLPPAMIDQVLDNLPIARVLQILCHGTQSLKDSVFNHQQYGHLFGSPHRAAPVLKLYCLYRDICWFRHLPLSKQSSYMSNIYHEYPRSLLGRVSPFQSEFSQIPTGFVSSPQFSFSTTFRVIPLHFNLSPLFSSSCP